MKYIGGYIDNIFVNLYRGESGIAIKIIKEFWKEHNNYEQFADETEINLRE